MKTRTKHLSWSKLKVFRRLFIPTFGLFCVLIGLTEMARVILLYSAEYGFFVGFLLEIGLYAVGAAWAIQHYAKDFRKAVSDVRSVAGATGGRTLQR